MKPPAVIVTYRRAARAVWPELALIIIAPYQHQHTTTTISGTSSSSSIHPIVYT